MHFRSPWISTGMAKAPLSLLTCTKARSSTSSAAPPGCGMSTKLRIIAGPKGITGAKHRVDARQLAGRVPDAARAPAFDAGRQLAA